MNNSNDRVSHYLLNLKKLTEGLNKKEMTKFNRLDKEYPGNIEQYGVGLANYSANHGFVVLDKNHQPAGVSVPGLAAVMHNQLKSESKESLNRKWERNRSWIAIVIAVILPFSSEWIKSWLERIWDLFYRSI